MRRRVYRRRRLLWAGLLLGLVVIVAVLTVVDAALRIYDHLASTARHPRWKENTMISPVRLAAIAAILVVATGLTNAAPAFAAPSCKQWRVSPVFDAVQENGYTVRFNLRQWGTTLGGSAASMLKHTNFVGSTRTSITYGDVGLRGSYMAANRFTARVRWQNNVIGNYSAYVWYVQRTPSGSLWAELRGYTYPETGGALVPWRTYSPTGSIKPVVCYPADVVE